MKYQIILRAKEFPHRVRNVVYPCDTTEELCSYILSTAGEFWLVSAVLLPIKSEKPQESTDGGQPGAVSHV